MDNVTQPQRNKIAYDIFKYFRTSLKYYQTWYLTKCYIFEIVFGSILPIFRFPVVGPFH